MPSAPTVPPAPSASADALLAEELLEALSVLRRRTRRLAARPGELAPLTGAQLELVRLLRRRPGVSVAEAAAWLRLAPNTVSTLVGQLTEAGLVERRADPGDRRVARLVLAPAIARKVDDWRDRRALAVAEALGAVDGPGRRALADALPALARLADALADPGAAR